MTDQQDASPAVPTAAPDASSGRSSWPIVGVCENEKQPGANALSDPVRAMECLPLDEALTREWDTDAHFAIYYATNQEVWPRCNKAVLPKFRAIGGDLLASCIVIDIDNVGHKPWKPGQYQEFCERLMAAAQAGEKLATSWTVFYSTRGGVRLVYVLAVPLPVDQVEPYLRAIYAALARHLVPYHYEMPPLSAWGQIYRLPHVVRDGKRLSQQQDAEIIFQPENRLDIGTIRPVGTVSRRGPSGDFEVLDIEQPEPAASLELLKMPDGKWTAWRAGAERRLRGRECHAVFFKGLDFAQQGARHVAIWRMAGTACSLLARVEGSSPELVFALMVAPGLRIDPKTCRKDPFSTIWAAVLYCWSREAALAHEEALRLLADAEGSRSAQLEVLAGVREWCDDPALHGDEEVALAWLQGHLIACCADTRYVMRRDGHYDSVGVSTPLMSARVRELGMEGVIPLVEQLGDERWVAVSPQAMISRHGTVVATLEGIVGSKGGTIDGINTPHPLLKVRMFGLRTDLIPTYDARVDEWLHALSGESNYTRLCVWIGHSLAFNDGPICALSLCGPQGTGKGLLMQGLSECVDTQCYADTKEFSDFQGMLDRTPFLMVNEGFPSRTAGTRDVADSFRALVDGSAIVVNRKFLPPIVIRNPLRVVIAANNGDVVSMLAGHRDLTPDDQGALAIRIFHLETGDGASTLLRNLGGSMFTGRKGQRWVRGVAGEPSDHVLARHFLHLFETRPIVPHGNRLLVEGRLDSEIVKRLATRSGSAPDVVETIISMVENESPALQGIRIYEGRIFVTNAGVVDYYRNVFWNKTRRLLSHISVGKALASLTVTGSTSHVLQLPGVGDQELVEQPRLRWRQIDAVRLLEEAVEYGYKSTKLRRIANAGPLPPITWRQLK